ncbi:hypothetical protein N7471_000198 [Penicillium samsonianum]|uniref:uncharacterized protein n=1 Tax=Penicillium samsonianum TaxID=1882272 RepID=UPI00254770AC|nr:uncharacterized protein N7471_000198 [Penicillium samsonianum]KAJ6148999.1 hypothetical protein N7471_000198 [Penicillium samsonianum]
MEGHRVFPFLPSDEELQLFEEKIKYRFTDRIWARKALQTSSAFNEDGNKTLAMIGDAILRLVIVDHGHQEKKTRGEISNMITRKASNAYLSDQGFDLGIGEFIIMNPSQFVIGHNVMAATMEAIIGAVYLDCNQQIQPCADVMAALDLSWTE